MRWPAGARWIALASVASLLAASPAARAEIDYPVTLDLPEWDVALGVSGGLAFDEVGGTRHTGALVGVDAGLLHGVFGLHLGLRTWREGWDWRVGGLVEVTACESWFCRICSSARCIFCRV